MNEFLTPQTDPVANLTAQDRQWGAIAHVAALAGYMVPFGNIAGPALIWLIKKDSMPFVDSQGKESLNFQISVAIYTVALGIGGFILNFIGIGFLLWIVAVLLAIAGPAFSILAAIKANNSEAYRYPANLRLIK